VQLNGSTTVHTSVAFARCLCFLGGSPGREYHCSVFHFGAHLIHNTGGTFEGFLVHITRGIVNGSPEIPTDNFLARGLRNNGVVHDTGTDPVHSHIRRRMVHGFAAGDFFQHPLEQVESLNVPIVIHRLLMIVFKVVLINHDLIFEINRGCFVGYIDHVIDRKVPDGEGFELGIASLNTAFIFVVKVVEASSQLSAARAGTGNDHDGLGGLDVFVDTITLVADNGFNIGGITTDGVMGVDFDAPLFQAALEGFGRSLVFIAGYNDGGDIDAPFPEIVNGLEGVVVVGNAKIGSDLLTFNSAGMDTQDNVNFILEQLQQTHFDIGIKAREHPGSVIIEENLAAKLQVKFIVEAVYTLEDGCSLFLQVFFVVKSNAVGGFHMC